MPHLKRGVIRYSKSILKATNIDQRVTFNKTENVYNFGDCVVEFISADRIGAALGNRRYCLYANEINNLNYEIYEEMARRSTINLFDFNPTSKFWLEEKLLPYYPRHLILKSNYTNNYFLPDHERERIELRSKLDPNFKRVHIDCEYGIYEGLVFNNWQQVDEVPEGKTKYGMDFGYTNHPTALIKVVETDTAYYLDELIYEAGLLNRSIAGLMQSNGIVKNYDEIYADSAEPKSIDEIKEFGFNIKPAIKGQGSVNMGIDRLKSKNLLVTKRSVGLIQELRDYRWVTDKEGNPTNKPVDAFNHAIDAARYAISAKDTNTDTEKLQGLFF
jgi:phage terminase large subunit